jgi:inorganic triphosphatase YgiF
MGTEVELKLTLAPSAQRALLRHPLLRGIERQTQKLDNTYFDTPDLALKQRGIALRLRRQGRQLLQTVKCAGETAGGLSSRPEWETAYTGQFDFSPIDNEDVRQWLQRPKISGRLLPVFETAFTRNTWRIEAAPGTVVLVMLDRGWIVADGHREPISELEIELAQGPVRALFDLALQFAERIALSPQPGSKAERGYALFSATVASPAKAADIPLHADMSPDAAFRRIAGACLDHLQRNHDGAVASDDPEYIHQMRVATRRLRAALRLFRRQLAEDFAESWLPGLRAMMAKLGEARDLDVLTNEIIVPIVSAMPDELRLVALAKVLAQRRDSARAAAREHLRSRRYGRELLLTLSALAQPQPADATAPGGEPSPPLAAYAAKRIKRLRARLLELAEAARSDDPLSLHQVRIAIKRLRYALEFFSPLLSKKPLRRAVAELAELQDALGKLNDLASAGRVLMDCACDDAELREAVTLVGGWHGPRHAEMLARVPGQIEQLRRLSLPRIVEEA